MESITIVEDEHPSNLAMQEEQVMNTKATQTSPMTPCTCQQNFLSESGAVMPGDTTNLPRNIHHMPTRPVRPGHPSDVGHPAMPHMHPGNSYHGHQHSYYSPPPQPQWPPPRISQLMPPQMKYRPYPPPPPDHHGYHPQPNTRGPPSAQHLDDDGRRMCNIDINFRPDDVLVATFPRSGTTWTIEIVRQLHLKHIDDKNHPLNNERQKGGMFLTPQVTKEMVEDLQSPRILKTHSYYSDLGFDETFKKCKVIHVIRDPKDVYCSIFEHAKKMHFHGQQAPSDDESERFQRFLDGFIKGRRYQGPGPANWPLFTDEYLKNERNLEILHIRYDEDLKQNPEATILKISSFLGYTEMTTDDVVRIKELTSYNNMRSTHSNVVHENTKGKSGTYKGKLTEKNITDINNNIANFLEEYGDMDVKLDMYCNQEKS